MIVIGTLGTCIKINTNAMLQGSNIVFYRYAVCQTQVKCDRFSLALIHDVCQSRALLTDSDWHRYGAQVLNGKQQEYKFSAVAHKQNDSVLWLYSQCVQYLGVKFYRAPDFLVSPTLVFKD